MRKRNFIAVLLLGAALARANARALAQSSAPSATPPDAPTSPASAVKDRGKAAPVKTPGAQADQGAPQSQPPAPPAKKPSTADDNPFPEDVSKKAAADAKAAATTNAPSAPAARGSSSLDGMDKLGLDDPSRRQLKLESPDGSPDVYDPKRAAEDVRVGKFYMKTGNYKGALERFKDAASFDHEDADAIFWMAEAARKMNLHEEAVQEYQVYLDAVPEGANAKAARKALGELATTARP